MLHECKRLAVFIVIVLFIMSCAVEGVAVAASIQPASRPKGVVDLTTAIVRVANQAMPAVVYIEVTESRMVQNPLLPFENNPFFKRFFCPPNIPRKCQ